MSDEHYVECGTHGSCEATYLCQHLPEGKGLGFNVGYDPENPDQLYPDAWCDQCDAVLEQEGGEWNERAEAFADIKLVCADCYCEIRERNWPETGEELEALLMSAVDYLDEVQQTFRETYKINEHPRWDWSQDTCQLVFSRDGKPVVECDIDFVGSFSSRSDSWMWAWANDSFVEPIKEMSREVRGLGEVMDSMELSAPTWSASPEKGWLMTAVMAQQLGAIGAYRTSDQYGHLYMVVRAARWVG